MKRTNSGEGKQNNNMKGNNKHCCDAWNDWQRKTRARS